MRYNEKFIKEAYKKVPMYMKLPVNADDMTFEELPVVDKNYVIKNEAGAISADHIVAYYRNELMKCRTSGSIGKYMEIYWSRSDYNKSMLPLWMLRKKYYGINPDDKMCYFYTLNEGGEGRHGRLVRNNQVGYSKSALDMESLREIYMDICNVKPKWMLLQPSMAVLLCQCVKRYELPIIDSLEYVEMSGEILTEQVRKDVCETFRCRVVNQYGANEFNSIAYECPYGNMHILTSNVYVEVMKNGKPVTDGEEGELIITTKNNQAMPLIRYKIGDVGKIEKCQCRCGNSRPVLKLTSGRTNDWILRENGEKKTVYVLLKAIDSINYMTEGTIKQFQIVQSGINELVIRLVINEDEQDEFVMNGMEERLVSLIGDEDIRSCDFRFEYYDEMFPDEIQDENGRYNGKFKYFKREI